MTLGTGVFLSSALLGFILLFVVTKDRWNWRKIGIRLGILVIVIPAAIVGYLYLSDDVSRTFYRLTASKQTELWGIKLGSSKADVLFLKGKPSGGWMSDPIVGETPRQELERLRRLRAIDSALRLRTEGSKWTPEQRRAIENAIERYLASVGLTPKQFKSQVAALARQTTPNTIAYSNYVISLDDDGVVYQIVFRGKFIDHEGFFGIRVGTRVEDLEATLGAPSNIKTAPDNSGRIARRYDYKKYNLRFVLREGKVSSYAVYDFSGQKASQPPK